MNVCSTRFVILPYGSVVHRERTKRIASSAKSQFLSPEPMISENHRFMCLRRAAVAAVLISAIAHDVFAQRVIDNSYYRKIAARSADDMLDDVVDIAAGESRRIFVADGKRGMILLLDANLRVVGQIGRKGSGPGEYREIQAIKGTATGVVAIDRVLRRIYEYSWSGSSPQLLKVLSLDFEPYDICPTSDGNFVALGRRRGARIHLVDGTSGAVLRSGARFDPNISTALSDNLIEGRMSCGDDDRRWVVTSAWTPLFDIVSAQTLQSVRRDSLSPVRRLVIQEEKGRLSFSSGPQGYHSPLRAFFRGDRWVFQAAVVARVDGAEDDSVSFFLTSSEGRPVAAWKRKDRIFPISRDSAIAVVEDLQISLRKVAISEILVGKARTPGTTKAAESIRHPP